MLVTAESLLCKFKWQGALEIRPELANIESAVKARFLDILLNELRAKALHATSRPRYIKLDSVVL